MSRKNKAKIRKIKIIVSVSAVFAFVLALIIINFFIPVIYFTAYCHLKKDKNQLNHMRVRFIDAGYGDSVLVELPDGKTLLIDGGTGTYNNVYTLFDVLNSSGIETIDYLICTSVKSEHCGALAEILKYKSVGTAYIPYVSNIYITDEYAAFYKQLLKSGARVEIAENGKGINCAEYGYFFGVMSPHVTTYYNCEYNDMNTNPTEENINNASAVVWLEFEGRGFMFLSDAGEQVQKDIADQLLLEQNKIIIEGNSLSLSSCTVLKASNHCANGYTQPYLYDLIQPEAVIISVGKNAQSSPSNTEIANLQLYVNDKIYRTDMHGTVTVTVDSEKYHISKEK